jgi:hypothetical protein
MNIPDHIRNVSTYHASHVETTPHEAEIISEQPKHIHVPEDLLARLRKEHADVEQFKKVANLELQVKELKYKNTILEIYVRMGLKPTDSFDINTGLAEIS